MDPEFDQTYGQIVAAFRSRQLFPALEALPADAVIAEAIAMAVEAVEIAQKELPRTFYFRSDAHLFLMTNLTYLVAFPLLVRWPDPARIRDTLIRDAITIGVAATKYVEGDNQISAASMLRGAADTLDKLLLKDWRLWDRK